MAQTKAAKEKTPVPAPVAEPETIVTYKGFDANLQCRGFQFGVGQTYECTGKIVCCENGFHGVEYPLDAFGYYPPGDGCRYGQTEQSGDLSREEGGDSKVASRRVTVKAEIGLTELIRASAKFILDRVDWANAKEANTGYRSASTNTGDRSASTVEGKHSVAMASGEGGRVKGADGCALFLVYRDPYGGSIKHAWSGIVGRDGIKANVWYSLDANGKPQEATP